MEKCKLCSKKVKNLQKSHFIPKSIYRNMEQIKANGYGIMLGANGILMPLSQQITNSHLCKACEDLFSKNGEKCFAEKALPKKFKKETPPEILKYLTKIYANNKDMAYFGKIIFDNKYLNENLFYFAVSVFWRGILDWTNYNSLVIPSEVEKDMRSYLLYKKTPTSFKIKIDLSTKEFYSVLFPIQITPNTYIFNIYWYIFTLEAKNSANSTPIKFGRNMAISDYLSYKINNMYCSTEKKGKKPTDLSWIKN